MKSERFTNWKYPEIEDGKPTKYNWVVQNLDGLNLGINTDIGAFSYINAKYEVVIGDEVQIVLKNSCRIGSHSTILPGVSIGKNSIIGAHSLVNKDIPDNVVAFGVPAKVMRKLTNDK
jgi:acetyltransferase-like isoleucine patch superfamily enzyme